MNIKWWKAAGIRAAKTFCQTAASLIGTGAVGFTDLDWIQIASVSGVAALVSILTSVAGLPEIFKYIQCCSSTSLKIIKI